jgi:hypothetical protein
VPATAAALLAAAGVFVLLLAVDVHRWQTRVAADDIAYRTDPARRDLWTPPSFLPRNWSREMLGLDDDVRSRLALQVFKLGHPRTLFFVAGPQLIQFRSAAQALLSRTIDAETDRARKGQEINLLGVLQLIAVGTGDPERRQQFLPRAASTFREALAADPTNADAQFNLELTLRLMQRQNQSGETQNGTGGIAARGRGIGSGY